MKMLSRQSRGEPAYRHAIQYQYGWTVEALRRLLDQKQRADQLNVSGQRQPVRNHPHCAGQLLAREKHAAKNIVGVKNSEIGK